MKTENILAGRKDAASLLGLGIAIGASLPFFSGTLPALATGIIASILSGIGLAHGRAQISFDKTDVDSREDFVLASDEVYRDDGVLVGYTTDNNEPVIIPYNFYMRHFALVGGSGVGKTTLGLWVLYQSMVKGGGWIFIDAKIDADTRDALGYMARAVGREDELYVLNVDDPDNSNTYNPLLEGDADEVASRLLNLLPSSEDNPGADFYRQSVNHALTVIIGALKVANIRYTFNDITIMMQSPQALDRVLRMIPEGTSERMQLEVFLDKYRKQEKGGTVIDVNKLKDALGGMAGRAATFSQGKFGRIFNHYAPEINLPDIMMNNKMLYVMLPTMGKDAAALNLGKMILSDLRTAVYKLQGVPPAERPWPPFTVFADEMGSYVMPGMARLFEQARSAQVALMPGFQAFGNLATVGDDFKDIVLQNTWTKAMYRSGSTASAEEASEIIGNTKKYQYSYSESTNTGESAQGIRINPQYNETDGGGEGVSYREVDEARIPPEKFVSLGVGQSIIAIGGRTYHVKVPMLLTPINDEKPGEKRKEELIFKPLKHPTKVPAGERVLGFGKIYKEFLMGAGINNNEDPKKKDENGKQNSNKNNSSGGSQDPAKAKKEAEKKLEIENQEKKDNQPKETDKSKSEKP